MDYAESGLLPDPEVQRRVLQILAASPELREQMNQLKKDLYLVNAQIPEFEADEALSQGLRTLAEAWFQRSLRKRFAFAHFLNTKEFFGFMSLLIFLALVVSFFLFLFF